MERRMCHYYGGLMIAIGMTMILTHVVIAGFVTSNPFLLSRLSLLPLDPGTYVIRAFLPLGFMLTLGGEIIRIKFREIILFLTKDGESIHSGRPWYKGSESGLFLTSCGLVVSINEESDATAHVGYTIIQSEHATHRDCAVNEGKAVLDKYAHGRAY
ncbi:MAG: hypothetical protein ACFFCP_11995 [Promethearchaeota archaeon]